MPITVTKLKPTVDLGEFLETIETEYNGKNNGIALLDADMWGLLAEKDLREAGVISELSYIADTVSAPPKIYRKKEYADNLNYVLLKIDGKDDIFTENGVTLLKTFSGIGLDSFMYVTYQKDESCYILVELYNEAGDKFDDEKIRILEQAIQ